MNNKNKKNGSKRRSFLHLLLNILHTILNFTLLAVIIYIGFKIVGPKQIEYKETKTIYNTIEEKKDHADLYNEMPQFLEEHNFDWITVSNTAIDYPLMQADDNNYYIKHDYQGNPTIAGAIFYDAYDEPFNGTCTVIYGHNMRNGTMFNNLQLLKKDNNLFKESRLIIETKDGQRIFKPLAHYITTDDFFYLNLDKKSTTEAVEEIKSKSRYFVKETPIAKDAHIMALYTCDYSIDKDRGRLVVFFIEDTQY